MTELKIAFRNFANAPKTYAVNWLATQCQLIINGSSKLPKIIGVLMPHFIFLCFDTAYRGRCVPVLRRYILLPLISGFHRELLQSITFISRPNALDYTKFRS